MLRLTKWNDKLQKWEFNVEQNSPFYKDFLDDAAAKLAVYEEFFPTEKEFVDFFFKTCQNCVKRTFCPYAAKWGEPVRYGCALFLGGEE